MYFVLTDTYFNYIKYIFDHCDYSLKPFQFSISQSYVLSQRKDIRSLLIFNFTKFYDNVVVVFYNECSVDQNLGCIFLEPD